jgi:hypothetical protein
VDEGLVVVSVLVLSVSGKKVDMALASEILRALCSR